jgi:hypothetical protein
MRNAAQTLFRSQIGEGSVDGYTAANMLAMLNPKPLEPVGDGNLVSPASKDPGLMQGNRPEFGRVG